MSYKQLTFVSLQDKFKNMFFNLSYLQSKYIIFFLFDKFSYLYIDVD